MFTSLMSFTITATFSPWRLFRTWFSKVVFPAPRKPDKMVTGSFCIEIKQLLEGQAAAGHAVFAICNVIT
ncbi:MAG TPA: hypothetical protein VF583_06390, partial [Bradyrhizobium sp.]